MVGLGGFEPPTSPLSGVRSNQLSYRPNLFFIKFIYTQKCHNEPVNDQAIEVSTYNKDSKISLRRWSSRRFPYGYLVTTSPQSWITKWWAHSRRLCYPLLLQPTPMVWRAVCTRPGNVFTVTFWFTITSDSDFMESSCRLQSGLRKGLWD